MSTTCPPSLEWVNFYRMFADRIREYRTDRQSLLRKMEAVFAHARLNNPLMESGKMLRDICPFTCFSSFNRGLKNENRTLIAQNIRDEFGITEKAPVYFDGIPVVNNMTSWFFGLEGTRKPDDIPRLWDVFEAGLELADHPSGQTRENFVKAYDPVRGQSGINWNLSMGLYWIRPYCYLSLDVYARTYFQQGYFFGEILENHGFSSELKELPDGETYLRITDFFRKEFDDPENMIHSFPELSRHAWLKTDRFPARDEYDPGITTEKWKELLADPDVFTPSRIELMRKMIAQGGEFACARPDEIYGTTHHDYILTGEWFGKTVHEKTACPIYTNSDGKEHWWPVLFLGRYVTENGKKQFVWRLRDELRNALNEIGI